MQQAEDPDLAPTLLDENLMLSEYFFTLIYGLQSQCLHHWFPAGLVVLCLMIDSKSDNIYIDDETM